MSPLRFYTKNHGKNIKISEDGSTAHRICPGFDEGMVFSSRPVNINEKVCLRITDSWNGDVRFGFTTQDPSNKQRCYSQHWAMITARLHQGFEKEKTIYYVVNSAGQVHYSLLDEDLSWFFSGVDVTCTLWAYMEIRGQRTIVQIMDAEAFESQSLLRGENSNKTVEEIGASSTQSSRVDGKRESARCIPENLSGILNANITSRVGIATNIATSVTSNRKSREIGATTMPGQSTPTTQVLMGQSTPTTQGSVGRSTPTTQGSVGRSTPTTQGSVSRSTPTTQRSVSRSTPTTQGSVGRSTRTTQGSVGQSIPTTQGSVGQSIPTTQGSVGQSIPTTQGSVGQSTPTTQGSASRSTPTTQGSVGRSTPTAQGSAGPSTPTAQVSAISAVPSTGNLVMPPLRFYTKNHGKNIKISEAGSTAHRICPGFDEGMVFSSRPVKINEKVRFRFINISSDKMATIRYGFANYDPATVATSVPKQQRKSWVWLLAKKFQQTNNEVYYHVDAFGEVCFAVNGEEKRVFLSNVDTTSPIWAIVHNNGVGTVIQFEHALNMQATGPIQSPGQEIIGEMQSLAIQEPLRQLTHQSPLVPLSLHTTKGRNIHLRSEFAFRVVQTFNQGYVFTALPVTLSQTIVIKIVSVQTRAGRPGGLAYGFTSCDPATLRQCDLPNDTEQLIDRPEYWVVRQHAAKDLREGDELAVTLSLDGEVQERRNNSDPITVMHVDHTLKLWAFVDLYESTQKVRMLVTGPVEGFFRRLRRKLQDEIASTTFEMHGMAATTERNVGASTSSAAQVPSLTSLATTQDPFQDIRAGSEQDMSKISEPSTSRRNQNSNNQSPINEGPILTDKECSVCFDKQVDSAVYKCGHMCMCYTCAVHLWKDGDGRCPICRAQIMEVIRIYRS